MSRASSARAGGIALWWEAIRRDRKAARGAVLLAFFGLVGLVGPWFVGDPNAFVGGISTTDWRRLNDDPRIPLFDRAVGDIGMISEPPAVPDLANLLPSSPDLARWDTEIDRRYRRHL